MRLTKRNIGIDLDGNKIPWASENEELEIGSNSHQYKKMVIDKLCEFEELEEKGLLVKLPCAIGDIIWLKMTDGTMAEGKVVDYTHFISCGFCLVVVSVEGTFNKMNIPFKDLIHSENDTIFLTKKSLGDI